MSCREVITSHAYDRIHTHILKNHKWMDIENLGPQTMPYLAMDQK